MPNYNNQYRVHVDGIEPDLGGWFDPPHLTKKRQVKRVSLDAAKKVRYEVVGTSEMPVFILSRHYSQGEPHLSDWFDAAEPGASAAAVRRDGRVEFIGEGGVVARIARWTRGLPVAYSTRQTPIEEGGTIIEAIAIQAQDIVI